MFASQNFKRRLFSAYSQLLSVVQTAQNAAIRAAINMGVFEKIPPSGDCISATDLSTTLQVHKDLLSESRPKCKVKQHIINKKPKTLVRVMRACTSTHLFQEVSPLHYAHNAFSAIFLVAANRDMFQQMYDFLGQGVYAIPHFLASINYQNPTDYDNSAFQYGHHTSLGFWEYLKEDPERAKVFNSGMRSLATVGGAARSAGPYPFEEQLGTEDVKETDVAIVDLGGGRGQALRAIKTAYPRLKGRMVLQDMRDVIEDAKADGLPSFIEPMAASFFEPQPVKGKHTRKSICHRGLGPIFFESVTSCPSCS